MFGDTVNTAARMESTSVENQIQVSNFTHELITDYFPNTFVTEFRGEISVKVRNTWITESNKSVA